MTIYEHKTTVPVASGTIASSTLFIPGARGSQLLVRANTSSTMFRVELVDEDGTTRRNWGFHTGELNDTSDNIRFAFAGSWAVRITNASVDDTFRIVLAVEEGR